MSGNCNNCGGEKRTPSAVPYQVLQDFKEMSTATIKRLWILIVVLSLFLVGSNIAWLYAWSSYDYISEEIIVESEDGGDANYIGNDGTIING